MNHDAEAKIRILILDDHAVFREGLALLLASEPDFEIVGKCGSVEEALPLIATSQLDLVLLDLDLGGRRGSEFCAVARDMGFGGKILVLTAAVTDQQAVQLLAQGASGIFLKHTSPDLLPGTMRRVMAGQVWIDPRLLPPPTAQEPAALAKLSHRERQVLMAVLGGYSNKEIATRLEISENAVKSAMQQLFAKTGVRSRSQLVRITMEYMRDRIG